MWQRLKKRRGLGKSTRVGSCIYLYTPFMEPPCKYFQIGREAGRVGGGLGEFWGDGKLWRGPGRFFIFAWHDGVGGGGGGSLHGESF